MVHKKTGRITSGGPREFCTGVHIAIGLLWCSLMSVGLFYTLMIEEKNIGEIIDESRRNAISAT